MSDAPKPHTTVVQAGIKLGQSVIHRLSPQFIAVIVINAMFLLLLFWFLDARATSTASVLNQLLQSCMAKQP